VISGDVSAQAATWPQARSAGIHSGDNPDEGGLHRPDVVFIALHGKGGEDGTIQGMLELLGLPYTGSGVLASALAMDKSMTKRLFRTHGIPVIDDVQIERGHCLPESALVARVEAALGGFPVFVKPNAEGSTFGCTLVTAPEQLAAAIAEALRYDRRALIEKYIQGTEITVGVLGNAGEEDGLQALPIIEIVPKSAFYDYESKYAEGGSEHIIPARISHALTRRAQDIALQCHELLGCRGMSRTDMIVAGDRLYVLEVNTIPGMTPTSLLPQAAAYAGIPFSALLDRLIASALK
jgi:D-alanine-D-alanine ligase